MIDDENKRAYTVKGIHLQRQEKTILLSGLRGRIDINSRIDSMVDGTLAGKNTYRQFYIKGSSSTWFITLRIHSIGSAPLISAP